MALIHAGASSRLGLALSGGGYRAAAFHLGTLRKLDELGFLQQVDVLSTISGGSITGAAYCLHKGSYPAFHAYMTNALLTCSVVGRALRSAVFGKLLGFALIFLMAGVGLLFTRWAPLALLVLVLFVAIVLKYQFRLFPISQEIEKAYDHFFYHGRTLQDLSADQELAIGSSNLQTGRPFTFSKNWMGDSTYTYCKPPIRFRASSFPIARAVTASSCVPFAFTPVPIALAYVQNAADYNRISPQLIDGGVYDNQGIQKLTQPNNHFACDIIVTSDAGGGMTFLESYPNTAALMLRTVDLFMNRIKNFQMAASVFQNGANHGKPIAYLSLSWRLEKCIPGFVDNMVHGNVLAPIMAARQLLPDWINEPEKYRNAIEQHLEQQVGYAAIAARDLTRAEWEMARRIGTNLTRLSPAELNALVRHAENLTELQVKLYLP